MNNKQSQLSHEQLEIIERFITAYNAIDHYLHDYFKEGRGKSFTQLVRQYAALFPRWQDGDQLLVLAELRNYLVHERREVYQYLAVPTLDVVQTIEQARDRLLAPELVLPRFQHDVITVQYDEPLAVVLKIINEKSFSQYPVYQGQAFAGLLTENGITRWLARHVSQVLTLVDFTEEKVGSVLAQEERRPNYDFIPRDSTVLEAESKFAANVLLEALFITQNGKSDQALLGIITRWDVINL